jgi:hypothetical protein
MSTWMDILLGGVGTAVILVTAFRLWWDSPVVRCVVLGDVSVV